MGEWQAYSPDSLSPTPEDQYPRDRCGDDAPHPDEEEKSNQCQGAKGSGKNTYKGD